MTSSRHISFDEANKERLLDMSEEEKRELAEGAGPASRGVRKRRRDQPIDYTEEAREADELAVQDETFELAAISAKRRKTMRIQGVRVPDLIVPKSMYQGWTPPMPVAEEKTVLQAFLSEEGARKKYQMELGDETFTALYLNYFSFYRPHKLAAPERRTGQVYEAQLANEFVSLRDICTKSDGNVWYMDGIIHDGLTRRYVQRIPFKLLSIGGYENFNQHTVRSHIWIQSVCGNESDVWYCLENPSPEYRRFHDAFLWLADFAKHLIDYLYNNETVSLNMLRRRFYDWLQDIHGHDSAFQQWLADYPDVDFRRVITAHPHFLYNEARQLDPGYESHPLWGEVHVKMLNAVPEQPRKEKKTVVTPYVYKCFKSLWGKYMEPRQPSQSTHRAWKARKKAMHFTVGMRPDSTKPNDVAIRDEPSRATDDSKVCVGDVVQLLNDGKNWKGKDDVWYAYVQGIDNTKKRVTLQVIWLYRPSETTCSNMYYPSPNELFFSDHCNCGDPHIYADEVVCKTPVVFFESSTVRNVDYFIRSKYMCDETAYVSLKSGDFRCKCQLDPEDEIWQIGDTLLVSKLVRGSAETLEPVELVGFVPERSNSWIRVRRLLRRGRDYGHRDADKNELVYTKRLENVPVKDVFRRCHVRFYTRTARDRKEIPPPYCQQGTGDAYYIMYEETDCGVAGSSLQALEEPFRISLRQGFDPTEALPQTRLRGLDLFSGGGNFGRGLEEGGAVRMEWALDWNKWAMHSYRANLQDPDRVKLFYGSANDFLAQALSGKGSALIPGLGEVEFISAGSPCQGFSNANQKQGSDQSLRNSSMVASVASYIDLYRPDYAVLENVPSMASCSAKEKSQNAFSQMLCTLVGMGYQVQQFHLDAWSFGNPQSRSRLFILATAPGLDPPPKPPLTHSHPEATMNRSLGRSANGHPFGARYWALTPFEYVTIGEATSDLPYNHDGRTTCIPFPDHQTTRNESTLTRTMIAHIPRFPRSQTFVKACKAGRMPPIQVQNFRWDSRHQAREASRSWQRVNPNALVPTVTTACRPADSFCGTSIHWDASRCLTIMEVRRAQGFPDHEVLVGLPAEQWKIVGNSVARQVALVLGLSLRSAWLANSSVGSTPIVTSVNGLPRSQVTAELEVASSPPRQDNHNHGPVKSSHRPQYIVDYESSISLHELSPVNVNEPPVTWQEQVKQSVPLNAASSTARTRLSRQASLQSHEQTVNGHIEEPLLQGLPRTKKIQVQQPVEDDAKELETKSTATLITKNRRSGQLSHQDLLDAISVSSVPDTVNVDNLGSIAVTRNTTRSETRFTQTIVTHRDTLITPSRPPRPTASSVPTRRPSAVQRLEESETTLHSLPGQNTKMRMGFSKDLAIEMD